MSRVRRWIRAIRRMRLFKDILDFTHLTVQAFDFLLKLFHFLLSFDGRGRLLEFTELVLHATNSLGESLTFILDETKTFHRQLLLTIVIITIMAQECKSSRELVHESVVVVVAVWSHDGDGRSDAARHGQKK
jgi:hypothetical protein